VHPAVVAAAAAAIAAAAEAAGEEAAAAAAATAAAAREREALAATGVSCTIAEEGEENSSVVESVGADADAEDNGPEAKGASDETGSSCSEEWWCGDLTGLTVRDIMTRPLQVVSADADVSVARQLMVQHNLPGILVDVGPGAEPGFLTRR
jgi:CBS domain-containing protein